MKKMLAVGLVLVGFTMGLLAQDTPPAPPQAEKVKTWIALIGDNTQLVGGYAAILDTKNGWKAEYSPTLGVQGNVATWKAQVPVLRLQTTLRPGLDYFYATKLDRHLIGVGLCGTITALPKKLADLKDSTGLVSKLPGNLDAVDWHVGVGIQADAPRNVYVSAGLSLKW